MNLGNTEFPFIFAIFPNAFAFNDQDGGNIESLFIQKYCTLLIRFISQIALH